MTYLRFPSAHSSVCEDHGDLHQNDITCLLLDYGHKYCTDTFEPLFSLNGSTLQFRYIKYPVVLCCTFFSYIDLKIEIHWLIISIFRQKSKCTLLLYVTCTLRTFTQSAHAIFCITYTYINDSSPLLRPCNTLGQYYHGVLTKSGQH